MKNHEKRRKEISGMEGKKDLKGKAANCDPPEVHDAESRHHPIVGEETTARISFLIDFSLAEGQIQGKITHRLTNKQMEFVGLDQATIAQFMKKYLSRLEKVVPKTEEESPLQPVHAQAIEKQKEEESRIQSNEIRTLSYRVIPVGYAKPTNIIPQGHPFQLQWCLEPPPDFSHRGERMNYKVSISRKQLAGGHPQLLGEKEGEIDFSEPMTAFIHSEPLSPGTYRLESDARFILKSKKTGWSGSCHDSRVIHVD
jgi:hypothetical protein